MYRVRRRSGGIDSALICGLMSQKCSQFTAYNVGFPGTPFDESEKVEALADLYGQRFETILYPLS